MKEGTFTICLRTLEGGRGKGGFETGNTVLVRMRQLLHSRSPDVSLLYEHSGVVNALGQAQFEHLSLQPSLQEVFHLET